MNSCAKIWVLATVAVLGVVLCFTGVHAQEEIQCQGQDLNMTDAQKGFITDCLKDSAINSIWKIPMEKLSCFGVCILEKKNLLTAEGKLDHDKIYDYIYHVMLPETVKKPLVDGMEKCIKDFGEQVRVPDDPSCTKFLDVGQCVHDVFLDICFV